MRLSTLFTPLLVAAALAGAAAPPATPVAGVVRDANGTLHPVYGISANLINGQPLAAGPVAAAAFSDTAGLILVPGALKLISLDGSEQASYATSETHPILNIGNHPESAVAWLPSEEKFIRYAQKGFAIQSFDASQLPGAVAAIDAATASAMDVWVTVTDTTVQHLRISPNGDVTPLELTAATPKLAEIAGALVFADAEGLQIRSSIMSPETLPVRFSDLNFERAANQWLHITSASAHREWMLHLSGGHAVLSELPAISSPTEARR